MRRLILPLILLLLISAACAEGAPADIAFYRALFRSYCNMYGLSEPPDPIVTEKALIYDTPDYRIIVACETGDPDAVLINYKKPFDYDFIALAYSASAAFMPGDYQKPLLMSFVFFDGSTGVAFTDDRTGIVYFQETEAGYPQMYFKMGFEL